jgi:MFS family permease
MEKDLNYITETPTTYDAFAHEDEDQFPDGGIKAWLVVFGSAFGLMTVFGIMETVASIQLHLTRNQLVDVKLSSISWIFSIYMFLNLSMGIISGPIFDIYGIKWILIIGAFLNCGGLYATAFSTKLWQFILSFGICSGLGSGIMLNPLVGVVSHWFLKNRGWANGISECGSISGVFFPIMLRQLFPKLGFEKTMIILASICMFLCILAIFLVKDRSEILNKDNLEFNKSKRLLIAYKNLLNFKSFKQKNYLFLVIGLFFDEFSIILVMSYIATYGTVRNLSESTMYIIVTIMNACNIVGRIIPSYLGDKIGRFNVMIIILIIMVISLFAIWLPYYNIGGLYAFVSIYGFTFGAVFALTPVLIAQISHTKDFGSRFATAYFVVAFGNLIAMPIGSQFINQETISNYNNMIIFAGCTCAFAAIMVIISRILMSGYKLICYV